MSVTLNSTTSFRPKVLIAGKVDEDSKALGRLNQWAEVIHIPREVGDSKLQAEHIRRAVLEHGSITAYGVSSTFHRPTAPFLP